MKEERTEKPAEKQAEKIQIATLEQVILAKLDSIAEMLAELLKVAKQEEEK